jgi:hypothetical protein
MRQTVHAGYHSYNHGAVIRGRDRAVLKIDEDRTISVNGMVEARGSKAPYFALPRVAE